VTPTAAPSGSGPDELLSSSSIFDHVDRLSRGSSDGTRRQANKVQLIAMQPMAVPPILGPAVNGKPPEHGHMNKEVRPSLHQETTHADYLKTVSTLPIYLFICYR